MNIHLKYIYIFTALGLAGSLAKAQNRTDSNSSLCTYSSQIHYSISKTESEALAGRLLAEVAATQDLHQFCQWNRMDRFAEGLKSADLDLYRDAKKNNKVDEAVKILLDTKNPPENPWVSSMAGHPRLKSSGYDSAFSSKGFEQKHRPEEILKLIENPEISNNKFKDARKGRRVFLPEPTSAEIQSTCRQFEVGDLQQCQAAISELAKFTAAETMTGPIVIGANKFREALNNPNMTAGLKETAVTSLKRVQKQKTSNTNIFDELQQNYRKQGLSEKDAKSQAWDAMFLYSVGGPNFSVRAGRGVLTDNNIQRTNPNVIYGQALFESLSKEDGQKARDGNSLYSLPANTNFPCDIGKSYHFWMSAYLSRHLVQKGFPPDVAAKVTMMYGSFYHLKPIQIGFLGIEEGSEGASRSGFKDYARFGSIENGMRLDLNLAAAGAAYGASDGQKVSDIGQGFRESLKTSGLNPNRTKVDDPYAEWMDRLRPEAILKHYLK